MRIINLFCIFFILLGTTIVKAQEKSLATLINEKDVFLVDVRTPEEFAKGSATNAVNRERTIPRKDKYYFIL